MMQIQLFKKKIDQTFVSQARKLFKIIQNFVKFANSFFVVVFEISDVYFCINEIVKKDNLDVHLLDF